jgi:hypothetical protein
MAVKSAAENRQRADIAPPVAPSVFDSTPFDDPCQNMGRDELKVGRSHAANTFTTLSNESPSFLLPHTYRSDSGNLNEIEVPDSHSTAEGDDRGIRLQ